MVEVNLYSKKKRTSRLSRALIVVLLISGLILGARFFTEQAFEFRLRQISRLKGYLFDNTGTYLTGNLKNDIQLIKDKKQEYINAKNRLNKQVKDLRDHVQNKSREMDVFRTMNSYYGDENAIKTILTTVGFKDGKGTSFYYLIYDSQATFFPSPTSTPTLFAKPAIKGNLEFADLYTLQLVNLEVGEIE